MEGKEELKALRDLALVDEEACKDFSLQAIQEIREYNKQVNALYYAILEANATQVTGTVTSKAAGGYITTDIKQELTDSEIELLLDACASGEVDDDSPFTAGGFDKMDLYGGTELDLIDPECIRTTTDEIIESMRKELETIL